jgi:hypothetical protein
VNIGSLLRVPKYYFPLYYSYFVVSVKSLRIRALISSKTNLLVLIGVILLPQLACNCNSLGFISSTVS